jgi:hypothetical protein
VEATIVPEQAAAPEPQAAAPEASKVRAIKRAPLPQARAANKVNTLLDAAGDVQAADVTFTSKGTNPKKARVYGYDNFAEGNGGVPKTATVKVVPGATLPKGVAEAQWAKLVLLATAENRSVQSLYDNGVTSRTVRRSYRGGAIRFVK